MIKEQKGIISAGKITNAGLHCIGKTVFHLVNTNNINSKQITKEKGEAARLDMLTKVAKANKIKAIGETLALLTIEQLHILIALLRHHKDKKMPTKKGDTILCLVEWNSHQALLVDEEVAIMVANTRTGLKQREKNDIDLEEEEVLQSEEV